MNAEKYKRRLTAIFSADVAGYSRLMGDDEAATVNTITIYRGIMADLIEQHRGRLVDSQGDNLLAEFASVVDATQCAVAVQKEIQARNSELPADRRMQFRIGINIGDVIEDGDRIYGDGVNIAARLAALADPGGICISKTAFEHIESKLPLGYEFIGEQIVKNIAKPVMAYKVVMDPRVTSHHRHKIRAGLPPWFKKTALTVGVTVLVVLLAFGIWNSYIGGRLTAPAAGGAVSIVVLPFTNLSDEPDQAIFSDGITEEIISALAKVAGFNVCSSTTAFSYKGKKDVDIRTIGRSLKVDKVLEGSVRKAGNHLRISAQLINVADDSHLWSEIYDREMTDVFKIQNEIAQAIVDRLKVQLLSVEEEILTQDYLKRFGVDTLVKPGETIEGGLSAFGANIDIAGTVSGGLEAFGFNIAVSGQNRGDLKFAGANVVLSGDFARTVSGFGANVIVSGVFEGDLDLTAARVVIEPTAVIKGDFVYAAALLERKEGSQIQGQVIRLDSEEGKAWTKGRLSRLPAPDYWHRIIVWVAFTLSLLLAGWLANHLLPALTDRTMATLAGSFWRNLGGGVLFLIAMPVCAVLCIATVIGLPIGILLVFVTVTIIYISRIYVALWAGRKLLGFLKKEYAAFYFRSLATGIVIIGLLLQIPIVGWIVRAGVLFVGAGAMARLLWKFMFHKAPIP